MNRVSIFGGLVVFGLVAGGAWARDECDENCLEAKGLPVPTYRAQPRYPQNAADRRIEGCAVISFVILPSGKADQYQIVDAYPKGVFEAATLKALNDWRFKVPRKPGRYAQAINFRIGALKSDKPLPCVTPSHDELERMQLRPAREGTS